MSQGIMFSFDGGVFQGSFILGFSNDVKGNFTPFFSKASGASSGIHGIGLSKVIIFTDAESIDDLAGKAYADGIALGVGPIGISRENGHTIVEKKYNIKSFSAGYGIGRTQAYMKIVILGIYLYLGISKEVELK